MPITKPTKQFIFTPQHEEIIRDALFHYHMLIASQITDLIRPGKPGNRKKIQERLSDLREQKYVIADPLSTKSGQHPLIYCLGSKGKRYMEEHGYTVDIYYPPSEFEHLTYKKMHTLELNNFLILAHTLSTFTPRLSFSDLQHELMFEKKPLEYLEGGLNTTGKLKTIKPDGLFKLHLTRPGKSTRHYNCFVELDRANVHDERIMGKIAAIYDFVKRGYFEKYYGVGQAIIFFVTTAGESRTEQLKKLFRQVFREVNPKSPKNQMFKFGCLPPLMQPQPTSAQVFTRPYFSTAYGDPNKLQTIIDLTD